jgi:hypothetical protein
MSVMTTASPQEMIATLPAPAKRELAVWLLNQFDGNAIFEMLREVNPTNEPVYHYEDPGPLTDEAVLLAAEERFLEYDREEAAYEKSIAR